MTLPDSCPHSSAMAPKLVCGLVLALTAGLICVETVTDKDTDKQQCALTPKERTECGYLGIPEKDCLSKGCCFDPSIPEVIWCYHSKAHDKQQCGLEPKERRECGYLGIPEKDCLSKGCCFDPSIPEVIWCYHSKAQDKQQCGLRPKERTECGYPRISEKECLSKGCCFDSSIPEVIWCYHSKAHGRRISAHETAHQGSEHEHSDEQQFGLEPKERIECGYLGIPEKDCLSKGCWFDPSIPGVIWCYHSKAQDMNFYYPAASS